jgi:hypothetical protein
MRTRFLFLGLLLLGQIRNISGTETSGHLSTSPELESFFQFVKHLDLTDPKISLEAKQGEGTSPYFKIKLEEKTWGAILPESSGTQIYGEIFSFNLARALGQPELSGWAAFYRVQGSSLTRFKKEMSAVHFANVEREKNRLLVLSQIEQHPAFLDTVVKKWGPKPYDYDAIMTPDEKLNEKNPLALFLLADHPQPTDQIVTLPKIPGQAREIDLARQLSTIFLIDALAGQGDRFSQGNLNVIEQKGQIHFVAYDNGGTWGDEDSLKLYLSWVTRFDRGVADRIVSLNEFLNGKHTLFQGFHREIDLQKAMGLEIQTDYWNDFKQHLATVARHIQTQKGDCFFHP